MTAKKEIRINGIDMMCMGCTPGIWTHPRDRTSEYNTLEYWTNLARVMERGLFDCLFLPDIYGVYDVYRGGPEPAFEHAVEFPLGDPMMVIPAMAHVTEHLSFGVTGTLTYEQPFSFARRLSTIDHLTRGRFAWNIVTGYLHSAARAFGLKDQLSHDQRYDRGDEFMEIVYRLWEKSWEDGAVIRDRESGVFADPSKIHKISHKGKWFELEAVHLCEPSPQRTPVLFQAGASSRGRDFAVRHAECVFINGRRRDLVANTVKDLRSRAEKIGRDPQSLRIFTGLSVITAPTRREAEEKLLDYQAHMNMDRTLTLISGYAGVDFSKWDLDKPVSYFKSDAIQTFIENITIADPTRTWTLREVALRAGIGATREVGDPVTIADAMESWMDETGVDGFNIVNSVLPADFEDFVDLVVPELQNRGRYKSAYAPGTFREKLFGAGNARLKPPHPARV
jgi:alkanesulfonate monooxygenase